MNLKLLLTNIRYFTMLFVCLYICKNAYGLAGNISIHELGVIGFAFGMLFGLFIFCKITVLYITTLAEKKGI